MREFVRQLAVYLGNVDEPGRPAVAVFAGAAGLFLGAVAGGGLFLPVALVVFALIGLTGLIARLRH